jgi:hypothetical protein
MNDLTAEQPLQSAGSRSRIADIAELLIAIALCGVCACATPTATGSAVLAVPYEGSFALVLAQRHGPKLAVVTPEERWIVLVESTVRNSLMTEQEFLARTRLDVDTRSLQGVSFADGEEVIEPVFTLPGIYRFVISDNLETDPGKMDAVTIRVAYE